MPAEDVGFVMDRVVTAVRRGSSLLLFWPSILSRSPSIGVVIKEYLAGLLQLLLVTPRGLFLLLLLLRVARVTSRVLSLRFYWPDFPSTAGALLYIR
jgi:hypothetical protein